MKLIEAMNAGGREPEKAFPISAGRCEEPSGTVLCGARARWWYRNQFRCGSHLPKEAKR